MIRAGVLATAAMIFGVSTLSAAGRAGAGRRFRS